MVSKESVSGFSGQMKMIGKPRPAVRLWLRLSGVLTSASPSHPSFAQFQPECEYSSVPYTAIPMGRTMKGPPIGTLHQDLLWQIFAINTILDLPETNEEFDTRPSPLTTARHLSQVCASWRQLILDFSSIWGNIIDLEVLQQNSDAWRNEVLLRTGNSDLSIFGDICGEGRQRAEEFLEILLKNHWTRIKWIHVKFSGFDTADWSDMPGVPLHALRQI